MKKYVIFLMAIGLSAHVIQASSQNQQLENIIEVVQALKAAAKSGTSSASSGTVVTIPQATVSVSNTAALKSAFVSVVSSIAPASGPTFSCAQGLTDLHIGLSDSSLFGWINFDFDSSVMNQLTTVMNSGMYIVVNLISSDVSNSIQIQLTDMNNKVYATGHYVMPNGSTNGPKYAFIGFNTDSTLGSSMLFTANQTYYNWIDLTKGCKVLYKDGLVTTVGQGSTSQTIGAALEPIVASKVKTKGHPKNWQTPFIAVMATDSPVYGTPVSCAQGLTSLYVALSDTNMKNMVEFEFNQSVINQLPLGVSSAFDIVINLINGSRNLIQVQLVDSTGKVCAQGQYFIAQGYTGGPMYAFIGFNTKTPLKPVETNQTFVNWVNVIDGCRVQYQYAPGTTTNGQGTQNSTPPSSSVLPAAVGISSVALQPIIQVVGSPQAWSSVFNPTSSISSQVTGAPISCAQGLTKLHIGISDSKITNWVNFTFGSKVLSQLTDLMTEGMYIVVNLITSGNSNSIQVQLTDSAGNVSAQGNYLMPAGVNVGPRYAFIGFNTNNTLGSASITSNQTFYNWIDLTQGCRVQYQDAPGTTTNGQGGTFLVAPTAPVVTNYPAPIPPTSPLIVTTVSVDPNISNWKNAFLDVTSTDSPITGNLVSCAGGLYQLHIALSDHNLKYWLSFSFNSSVMKQLTDLMNVGMYIVINMMSQNGNNVIQVQLTDEKHNVFAQSTYPIPSQLSTGQGPRYAFIGFNARSAMGEGGNITVGPNKTYFNFIDLYQGCKILYQNLPGQTTPLQSGISMQSSSLGNEISSSAQTIGNDISSSVQKVF